MCGTVQAAPSHLRSALSKNMISLISQFGGPAAAVWPCGDEQSRQHTRGVWDAFCLACFYAGAGRVEHPACMQTEVTFVRICPRLWRANSVLPLQGANGQISFTCIRHSTSCNSLEPRPSATNKALPVSFSRMRHSTLIKVRPSPEIVKEACDGIFILFRSTYLPVVTMRFIFIAAAIWQFANGQGSNGTEGENEPLPPNDLALTPPMGCKYFSSIHLPRQTTSTAMLYKD